MGRKVGLRVIRKYENDRRNWEILFSSTTNIVTEMMLQHITWSANTENECMTICFFFFTIIPQSQSYLSFKVIATVGQCSLCIYCMTYLLQVGRTRRCSISYWRFIKVVFSIFNTMNE